MKKYVKLIWGAMILLGLAMTPLGAYADMGPKPKVKVKFQNFGDETVYATLFSHSKTSISPVKTGDLDDVPMEIQVKFDEYNTERAGNGFYINDIWIINKDSNVLNCGYMPPSRYEVVVYIPSKDEFINTHIYDKYAFVSSYSMDVGMTDSFGSHYLVREDNALKILLLDFTLYVRVIITIIVELLIALLFKIGGKSMIVLAVTNVITQFALNICLSRERFYNGEGWGLLVTFVYMELAVIVVEAVTYSIALRRTNKFRVSTLRAIAYAFLANVVSAGIGLYSGIL